MISIEYDALLQNHIPSQTFEKAFGAHGLGIIIVRNVPNLDVARNRLFSIGRRFAQLDPEIQKRYESPASNYSIGWSRGKEMMKSGHTDMSKGSFYANPLQDDISNGNEELVKTYPGHFTKNIWVSELPDFEPAFKQLGALVCDLALRILSNCDALLTKPFIADMFNQTPIAKSRLLHYYGENDNSDQKTWCGWHLDHGFITGLVAAQYYDTITGEKVQKPDTGGLMIRSRSGKLVRIDIPGDAIAFQIGETGQILSGGRLRATPHYVEKPLNTIMMDRVTIATFIDCPHDTRMQLPDDALPDTRETYHLPFGVPPLKNRHNHNQTYGDFGEACYKAYAAKSKQ